MKKPLTGWVTLTALGLGGVYTVGMMFNWIEPNPAVESFIMLMVGFGVARKVEKTITAAEHPEAMKQKESLEDLVRRNQK